MTTERLKEHADWLQDRADNPSTVMPGSTDPRSIVDSKRLGEIAKDIREHVEDLEDAEKLEMRIPVRMPSGNYVFLYPDDDTSGVRLYVDGAWYTPDELQELGRPLAVEKDHLVFINDKT